MPRVNDDGPGHPWVSVTERLPEKNTLVLVRGPSGYIHHREFFTSAYYNAEYRPHSPWLAISNDCLSDFGWKPTHWMPLDELY